MVMEIVTLNFSGTYIHIYIASYMTLFAYFLGFDKLVHSFLKYLMHQFSFVPHSDFATSLKVNTVFKRIVKP